MRLRAHRRNLVVWSTSVGPADTYAAPRLACSGRFRRCIRIGGLLTVLGLMRLAHAVRPRWRPLLAGMVLTVAGVVLRNGAWGAVIVPGLLFFWSAVLIPGGTEEDRERRSKLERELAVYVTPAQRCDLEATFDPYPDSVTHELRDILASQAIAAGSNRIPGAGRP